MCSKQGLWCIHDVQPWIISLSMARITAYLFMRVIKLPMLRGLNIYLIFYDVVKVQYTIGSTLYLHILVASHLSLQLFWP